MQAHLITGHSFAVRTNTDHVKTWETRCNLCSKYNWLAWYTTKDRFCSQEACWAGSFCSQKRQRQHTLLAIQLKMLITKSRRPTKLVKHNMMHSENRAAASERPPLLHRMSMTLYNVVVNMVVTRSSDILSTQFITRRIFMCKSRNVLFRGREVAPHMALQSHNQPSSGHVQMLMDYAATRLAFKARCCFDQASPYAM